MPAPTGRAKARRRRPGRSARKGAGRPRAQRAPRAPRPPRDARALPVVSDAGFALDTPRPFRPAPEYRVESTAGLRREVIELRAEVHRLAAEIDKLVGTRARSFGDPGAHRAQHRGQAGPHRDARLAARQAGSGCAGGGPEARPRTGRSEARHRRQAQLRLGQAQDALAPLRDHSAPAGPLSQTGYSDRRG